MKAHRWVLAGTFALGAGASHACGPYFPADLLGDRAGTLAKLPEGTFAFEARRLVAPAHWTVLEHADWIYVANRPTRESIERDWWGDRYETISWLRMADSASAAYAKGEGVPEEARRYMAGAAAFRHDDLDEAFTRFRGVLELAASERSHYGVWAQYMLGRVAAVQGDGDAAAAAFKATRALVAQGAQDPLGLAATSLGDEGKLRLDAGDDAGAIALYAEQAAAGSEFGRTSLLAIARDLMHDDARLGRVLADPLGQQLVTAYLLTRSGELAESPVDKAHDASAPPTDGDAGDPGVAAAPSPSNKGAAAVDAPAPVDAAKKIEYVLDAIDRAGLDHIAGADRVAALAYRNGRYELARKFAQKDSSGLAWWVRAKLALRAGDVKAATAAYAEAAKAFPTQETWGNATLDEVGTYETIRPQCRVEGEQGVLALARGEYLEAMQYLYNAASSYWVDAAYVAERVLTVDELEGFVDAHVAAAPPAKKPGNLSGDDVSPWSPLVPATPLRALLARRLLRAERYDEALRYFDEPEIKAKAVAYVAARRGATDGGRIEQAQAWFTAATAARVDGIDLLGYELEPDFHEYGGDFEWGFAQETQGAKKPDLPLPLVASDEPARTAATAAVPPQRFHYRYTAARFAEKAADLLPPRSQAFAAVLCQAAGWVLDRDTEGAQKIYRRYVKQGSYVPWAANFGRQCEEPDFPGASRRLHAERVAYFKHAARTALPYGGIALLLAGSGLILLVVRRRRRVAGAPADGGSSGAMPASVPGDGN